jgi:hypothetical protein
VITGTNTDQLTVDGSQFGYNVVAAINLQGLVQDVTVTSNFVLVPNSSTAYGIWIAASEADVIAHNNFFGIPPWPTGLHALRMGPTTSIGGLISGNTFLGFNQGILLDTNATLFRISDNNFTNVVLNFSTDNAANTTNIVTGVTGSTAGLSTLLAAVTGAVTDPLGSGSIEVTVSNASSFASGEMVMASNIGGVPNGNGITGVQVVDSTHLRLLNLPFTGTYTSGGLLSTLP